MPRKKSSDETSGSRQCRSEKTFAGWRSVKVWLGLWKHHRQEVFVDFTSQTLACFTNQSKPFAKRVIWACLRYFESWHSRSQLARKRSNHHPPENHVPQLHSTNETSQMHWKLWAKLNFLKNERVLDDRIMPIIPAPNSWLQTRLKFISKPKAKFTQLWLSHVQRLQDFPQLSQTTCAHISSYFLVVLDPKKNRSHWSSLLCLSRMHPARKDSCRTKTLHLALKNGSVLIVVWCPSLPMIHHSLEWLSKVVFEIAANMAKKAACECQVNWKCKTANS